LTSETTISILDALKDGKTPKMGPQGGKRQASEPYGGLTSLKSKPTGPGFGVRKDL
jgi:NADH dehydrogenase (ubiquinone) flavoprotein 2